MSNSDPICPHGIYLANCRICHWRLEMGYPLIPDSAPDLYQRDMFKPWFNESKDELIRAAEALIACSEQIYAGSWRVPSDCLEKLKEVIIKAKEK